MNEIEQAKRAHLMLTLATAAVELAVENRIYRQMYGELVLPAIPSPAAVSEARALLVRLRQLLAGPQEDQQIREVLGQIAQVLQSLRS